MLLLSLCANAQLTGKSHQVLQLLKVQWFYQLSTSHDLLTAALADTCLEVHQLDPQCSSTSSILVHACLQMPPHVKPTKVHRSSSYPEAGDAPHWVLELHHILIQDATWPCGLTGHRLRPSQHLHAGIPLLPIAPKGGWKIS